MDSGRSGSSGGASETDAIAPNDGAGEQAGISRAVERLARFQRVSAALLECLTRADCAETVLRESTSALGASAGIVVERTEETHKAGEERRPFLRVIGDVGYPKDTSPFGETYELDGGTPFALAVQSGKAIFLASPEEILASYPEMPTQAVAVGHTYAAWAAIPLIVGEVVIGSLGLAFTEPQPFTDEDRTFITGLAQQCALALERARLYDTVREQQAFLLNVLTSVTDGRLMLCDQERQLPAELPIYGPVLRIAAATDVRRLRGAVQNAAAACAIPPERSDELVTAAAEAATNTLIHADGGEGRICADTDSGVVQVWIVDHGPGIEFRHLPRATLLKGYTTAGTLGHGFKMILSLADQTYLWTGPRGTTVVLMHHRERPAPAWANS